MAIDIETKDCTALGDADIAELADMCAEGASEIGVGMLSKQAEEWVLITLARDAGRLKGFSFCTLERIGGTPCVLIGVASIKRTSKRDSILRGIVQDQLRRAVLAFPDEDVLVGARLSEAGAFEAFRQLDGIVPRPGYKASGEDRAWGRRLAKRFGIENGNYDDRTFIAKGDGGVGCVLDHESLKPEKIDPDVAALFDSVDVSSGGSLIAFGWAMAEDLAKLA